MNSEIEAGSQKLDTFKLGLALLIIVAGLVCFYLFDDYSLLFRVIGLLVGVGISVAIALQTVKGKEIWGYFRDAQIEVRKVVWPTRQETIQTTLIVIVMVILVAIILWLLDMFLGWSIGLIMGRG
ncbi:MAG: preprotein translocase subunit SecE [Legionellales bacterium]|jgi:preprotein translocase subunit SecE|nr:preprotein translocase subunit SecE [Legionellales bacterium]HBH11346.1 preprotein translocase subunit SecE [Gammaproteobacteria bacterium]|tara:strand:- start:3034 stop:3408 length:375 start_codon:yes stop_codon:yes gene_type:complete